MPLINVPLNVPTKLLTLPEFSLWLRTHRLDPAVSHNTELVLRAAMSKFDPNLEVPSWQHPLPKVIADEFKIRLRRECVDEVRMALTDAGGLPVARMVLALAHLGGVRLVSSIDWADNLFSDLPLRDID